MTEENPTQKVRITYVNNSGLNDEDIQRAIAGSDYTISVSSNELHRASNYLYSGLYRGTKIESGIIRTDFDFLNQKAFYIRNGSPQAMAITLTGKAKGLANVVEILGLPHVLEDN